MSNVNENGNKSGYIQNKEENVSVVFFNYQHALSQNVFLHILK